MPEDQRELYNIVTIKNIDDEDFVFEVDHQPYLIPAGQMRNFPRFMAALAVKHLIDHVLNKRDREGKLARTKQERQKVAEEVVVQEERYEKPMAPTDDELVDKMNNTSDIDDLLAKNRNLQRRSDTVIPRPKPDLSKLSDSDLPPPPKPKATPKAKPKGKKEKFAGLIPAREEMLSYAKNTLKMDIEDTKTKASFEAMDDEALFVELGMDQE